MKALALALALVACGGAAAPIATDDASPAVDAAPDAPVTCWTQGVSVACDPTDPWWFVATTDGHTDTFASCERAACPLKTACFVGSAEGYCR